ncbi:ligand-binding sensor domain-containing protein [Thalassotalea agarivorans]|nr:hypothetical protein [Thalassotalea agarivorans]
MMMMTKAKQLLISLNNRLSKQVLTCLLLSFISLPLLAQEHQIINQLNNVTDVKQDSQGYLWFSGMQGLSRYDGNSVITFNNTNTNWPAPFGWTRSISHYDDKFLVGSETDQVTLFDPITGQSKRININSENNSIDQAIALNNSLYLRGENQLLKHDLSTNQTKVIYSGERILQLIIYQQSVYARLPNGLHKIENDRLIHVIDTDIKTTMSFNNQLVSYKQNNLVVIDGDYQIRNIPFEERIETATTSYDQSRIYVVTDSGMILEVDKQFNVSASKYPNTELVRTKFAYHDSSNVLWLSGNQMVKALSATDLTNHKAILNISDNHNEYTFIGDDLVIGSYGIGLQNYPNKNAVFPDNINETLSSQALRVSNLMHHGEYLYVATFEGLWRYHKTNKSIEKAPIEDNNKLLLKLKHKDNKFYVATNYDGFYVYDINTLSPLAHYHNGNGLYENQVIDVLPIDDKNVWVASLDKINIVDMTNDSIRTLSPNSQNKILDLVHIENKVYAATKGDGVLVFNLQGEQIDQLVPGVDFSGATNINGSVWASSRSGLYQIDVNTNEATLKPNTQQYKFVGTPFYKNNKLYAPHLEGVLEVPVTEQSRFHPNVKISQVNVSGTDQLYSDLIEVSSPKDIITLQLASLDYRRGHKKLYRYRINGGQWNDAGSDALILTGLNSGFYEVELNATNSLGQWSNDHEFININVAYPWYLTPTLRIIYVFVALVIVLYVGWLLHLRRRSLHQITQIMSADLKSRGKTALEIDQLLSQLESKLVTLSQNNPNIEIEELTDLIKMGQQTISNENNDANPRYLYGETLHAGLPYLADYMQKRYDAIVQIDLSFDDAQIDHVVHSDIYKLIHEAITSAVLAKKANMFSVKIHEFNQKLWLTISANSEIFAEYDSRINMNVAMYYIRQIAKKYNAAVNTHLSADNESQLNLSIPLMLLDDLEFQQEENN